MADEEGSVHRQLLVVVAVVAVAALAVPAVITALGGSAHASTGSRAATSTTKVVRTDLASTVQVAGSIGYDGTATIVNPAGSSAQAVMQAQNAVTAAAAALAADRTGASDTDAGNAQAITQAQDALTTAQATVRADQAKQASDCKGAGASSPACASDGQTLTHDQTQLPQLEASLAMARLNATKATHQDQARLNSDTIAWQNAEAALTLAQRTAVNPGSFYTGLPVLGQVVSRGQAVYAVDGKPVPLFYGSVTAWREFALGMDDGPDVSDLTRNLIALGFGAGLKQSNHFSQATATAVKRWQASLGSNQTGTVRLGEVIFEPGPVRVTAVHPSLGAAAAPGPVIDITTTNRIVTVPLAVSQEYLVHVGDTVSVVLPDGKSTAQGHVRDVATVAVAATGSGGGGGGSNNPPTVNVTITLDDPAASGRLDQAPVNVNITDTAVHGVLAVPINALLALAEGGDAVEVVSAGTRHLAGVQTGLFSQTMVQISGPDITDGTVVEVPSG